MDYQEIRGLESLSLVEGVFEVSPQTWDSFADLYTLILNGSDPDPGEEEIAQASFIIACVSAVLLSSSDRTNEFWALQVQGMGDFWDVWSLTFDDSKPVGNLFTDFMETYTPPDPDPDPEPQPEPEPTPVNRSKFTTTIHEESKTRMGKTPRQNGVKYPYSDTLKKAKTKIKDFSLAIKK